MRDLITSREKQLIIKCIRTFESNCSEDMRKNWEDVIYDIEGSFLKLCKHKEANE